MKAWRWVASLLLLGGSTNAPLLAGKKDSDAAADKATTSIAHSALTPAINAFAVDLYRKLAAAPGNLIFSPLSISTVLTSLVPGAEGKTRTEMLHVLHIAGPASYRSLLAGLGERAHAGGAQWTMANRACVQDGLDLSPGFVSATRDGFGYDIGHADFAKSPEPSRVAINQWVKQQTQSRIQDLFPEGSIDPSVRLVLANAIYFKGFWDSQFDKANTSDAAFHMSAQQTATVPMMYQTHEFAYGHLAGMRVLELPYRGSQLSMVVLLPDALDGLAKLEKEISADSLRVWTASLARQEVEVRLPRFLSRQNFNLTNTLGIMGMRTALDVRRADFSGITGKPDLFLGVVVHGAFVEVNEEGTEAAAATGGALSLRGAMRMQVFTADHPFLYFIRDRQTGTILFMGRLVDPRG